MQQGVQKQVANYNTSRPTETGGANKGKSDHSRVKKAATKTIQVWKNFVSSVGSVM